MIGATTPDADGAERPSAATLLRYFLYLGSAGFGGPVALVGYMQRDLVERRRWFTREEYLKALALSQLAICLGFIHSRVRGATLVGLAFILPCRSSMAGSCSSTTGSTTSNSSTPWPSRC